MSDAACNSLGSWKFLELSASRSRRIVRVFEGGRRVWARSVATLTEAHSGTVSRVLRPVQDALQTFVFPHPGFDVLQGREVTALVAIKPYVPTGDMYKPNFQGCAERTLLRCD
jgi:hypothetical protein